MCNHQIVKDRYDSKLFEVIPALEKKLNSLNKSYLDKYNFYLNKIEVNKRNHKYPFLEDKLKSKITYLIYKYEIKANKILNFLEFNNQVLRNKNFNQLKDNWVESDLHLHRTNFFYFDQPKKPNHVLKEIETTFLKNKTTVILGKTGSGKSTLIQLLNGLNYATTGYIRNGNFYLFSNYKNFNSADLKAKFGLVFQFPDYQLFANTIEEEILAGPIALKLSAKNNHDYAHKYLAMVKLPLTFLNRSPFQLSSGQKRRLAIASILANQVETLILDEPNVGLDPAGIDWLKDLIKEMKEIQKKRVITITHDLDFALEIADQIKVVHEGKIAYDGDPFYLFRNDQLLSKFELSKPNVIKFQERLKKQGIDIINNEDRNVKDLAKTITNFSREKS
ncbi:ATP-binding cassette domain-containing protein [Mycoplasmopsis agassizii]|uniref:ABC transporter domain-containing protein n=1 Tax=Mycoplasmopsis agassizii TaxID=33922 RepID=A0ABX4H4S7_9BACT|nr:ATP-binding cassette domain-containing protein [Mycoplasmopsis agassizii]PAF54889.1 hypothetical protein CJF60_04090 [Mycoplasmopsis agassizii]SMC17280.1 energy-coupling factor transport system ATP-binding protein [Mycoplasmopsis agassizii]